MLPPHQLSFSTKILVLCVLLLILGACSSSDAEPEQATQPEPVAEATANVESAPTAEAEATPEVEEPQDSTADEEPDPEEAETAEPAEEAETTAPAESEESAAAEPIVFQIVSEGTEARFVIEEVLLGSQKIVTGTTSDVTGMLTVVPSDPSATEIGTLQINARDLTTDSSRRNRSIQRQILLTARDEYQYITFEPTSIDGLPNVINVGDSIEFSLTGDLKIVETTRSETFQVVLQVISEAELKGVASTTVLHADYDLSIPNVPVVASVEDEVRLELEFTAKANN